MREVEFWRRLWAWGLFRGDSSRSSPLRLDPIGEADPCPDEWDEVRCVDSTPPALCHVKKLEGHEQALLTRA
jgi:hypothetical protein